MVLRRLRELYQYAIRGFRMHKGDKASARATPGLLID